MKIAAALLLSLGVTFAQTDSTLLDVGATASPLTGVDIDGEALTWQRFDGRAVLLFFHAERAKSATESLKELVEACAKDKPLGKRLAVVVVTDGKRGAADARDVLTRSGLSHAIAIDAERQGYARYRAVAFPTVFAIDGERRIVSVVRGPGPRAVVKTRAAARLAAGLIERKEFERALEPAKTGRGSRSGRVASLVGKMIGRGSHARARTMLEGALAKAPEDPELLEIAVRLELATKDLVAAARRLTELEKVSGRRPRLRWLRAEVLLARGEFAEALAAVESLPVSDLRSALVKGQTLERLGRHEEAATVYRRALERELRRSGTK